MNFYLAYFLLNFGCNFFVFNFPVRFLYCIIYALLFFGYDLYSDAAKVDATSLTAIRQQIDEEKNKRLAFKEEVTAKLKDAKELSLGTEIPQGTLEQTVTVKIGDDLDAMMGAEILLDDGEIVAFRQ